MAAFESANLTLHWADILVFVFILVFSLFIGLYFACTGDRQQSTTEYLMGNRRLQLVPVAVSMFMSYVSAIYVLGTTAEMYQHGTMMFLSDIGSFFGFIFCVCTFVPLLYKLNVTSAFEYLDLRFRSRGLRITAVCILILNQVVYMGIAMFAPATALEAVAKFPVWASIIIAGLVTMLYTVMGGIKAVIWTDMFQGIVLFAGVIIVLIIGCIKVGGIGEVWDIAYKSGRIRFFDFNPDPTVRLTFWPLIIGRAIYSISWMGVAQTSVQRYCALETLTMAKMSVLLNIPLVLAVTIPTCLASLAVFAYYQQQGCDPLRAGEITSSNQLLLLFIARVINYPGLTGVLLAVLFSGALSSLSSSMNSLSAVTWSDILEPKYHSLPERKKVIVTKGLVFVYGTLAMAMAGITTSLSGHVFEACLRLVGGIVGPLGGIFILGAFFSAANWKGAIVGSVSAIALTGWMNIGAYLYNPHRATLPTDIANCTLAANATVAPVPTDPSPEEVFPLYRVSLLWVSVIGTLTTVLVGITVSFLTGRERLEDQDPRTLIPVCDVICCCIPKYFRGKFCSPCEKTIVISDDNSEKEKHSLVGSLPRDPTVKESSSSRSHVI